MFFPVIPRAEKVVLVPTTCIWTKNSNKDWEMSSWKWKKRNVLVLISSHKKFKWSQSTISSSLMVINQLSDTGGPWPCLSPRVLISLRLQPFKFTLSSPVLNLLIYITLTPPSLSLQLLQRAHNIFYFIYISYIRFLVISSQREIRWTKTLVAILIFLLNSYEVVAGLHL